MIPRMVGILLLTPIYLLYGGVALGLTNMACFLTDALDGQLARRSHILALPKRLDLTFKFFLYLLYCTPMIPNSSPIGRIAQGVIVHKIAS